jgi:hypothetical protein
LFPNTFSVGYVLALTSLSRGVYASRCYSKKLYILPYSVGLFVCLVWFLQQMLFISLISIDQVACMVEMNRVLCKIEIEVYTVEPGYNDIGLCDNSSITSDVLWY